MTKAEIAKGVTREKALKLNKLLTDAGRELGEKELDECLEAVEDANEIAGQ